MSIVSAITTPSYDERDIYRAVSAHFDRLEVEGDLNPDLRVLLKPNLLYGKKPDACVSTHPAVISAVIRRLRELGVRHITVADSSGGLYNADHMRSVYNTCGLNVPGIAEYLNRDFSFGSRTTQDGFSVRCFNLITPVLQADYIINLPKLKTHAMTTISAGVKNLFGTIPGLQKPDMHRRFPELGGFVRMLCELAATVAPNITLLDAVYSMEGNGPNAGTPRKTAVTLCSRDVFSLDLSAATFMGLSAMDLPHIKAAADLRLLPETNTVEGDKLIPCSPPFKLPDAAKSTGFTDYVPRFMRKPVATLLDGLLRSFPQVDGNKCVGCGKCAESCPQHIISIVNKRASMSRRGCISCFCCQEMCPVHAISTKRGLRNL